VSQPRISVVVPSYNHAPFLERRLKSIYGQTYDDFEVLLLDDASTDGSRDILRLYAAEHADNTRLVTNESNSGSPFAQWAKGIEAARGELVWIAESDDYCAQDFLEKIVVPFSDEKVVLSFAAPTYVDAVGDPTPYQYHEYTESISQEKWQHSYCVSAEDEVSQALGLRNTVPNVSAALFRRKAALPHISDTVWRSMRIMGDWCFYLRLIRGAKVAFVKDVDASFTHTAENTSAAEARTARLLAEHAYLIGTLSLLYPHLDAAVRAKNYSFIEAHLRGQSNGGLPSFAGGWHGATLGERDLLADQLAGKARGLENVYNSWIFRVKRPLRSACACFDKLRATGAGQFLIKLVRVTPEN
jgi:hypothetical protein